MKARFKAKKCFLKAALFLILKGKKISKLFKKQGFWYFVTRVINKMSNNFFSFKNEKMFLRPKKRFL